MTYRFNQPSHLRNDTLRSRLRDFPNDSTSALREQGLHFEQQRNAARGQLYYHWLEGTGPIGSYKSLY